MKKHLLLFIYFSITISATAQNNEKLYNESFEMLSNMIADGTKYNFKEAVFSMENAYFQGKLDTVFMNREIRRLKNLCNSLIKDRFLAYVESDKKDVNKWAATFQVMCESIPIVIEDKLYRYIPFAYDFNDVFGNQEASFMFVSKLLYTRKGNCRSLPYLYKILCEELGTTAHLALAPNHIYIKHQNNVNGWYNTELTSGIFPNDSWIMASGFIHLDAISNGVYMKALNNNESIALIIIDLANAYQKSFPQNDGTFLMKCADVAIEAYPNFATALILRAELRADKVENEADAKNEKADYKSLEKEYGYIHELGYRFMPEEMYLNWIISLKAERDKYENKKLNTVNKQ